MIFGNPLVSCSGHTASTDPFQLAKLGKSGLETTLMGMGTGINASNRSSFLTRQDRKISLAIIRHAFDRGVRLFDSADSYGTHQMMAEVFQSVPREKLTLVSKIWVREGGIPEPGRPDANIVVKRFLREMKTDYLDLVQLHCMVDADWTDRYRRQMDILSDLKSKGLIRAHGTSVHSIEAMKAALASEWTDVIHVRVNPYGIAMDLPEPQDVISVIHRLHDSGKGVIGMKLVGGGRYTADSEKIDNTLRFVLGLGSVDAAIIGFQETAQIDDYTARMEKALSERKSAS
jgi:aryl-alcohol dehydrogenase-like predicted oxidoreductase